MAPVRSISLLVSALCMLNVLVFVSNAQGQAKGKDGEDDVIGIRWHYEIFKGDEEKPFENGVFRVANKEIFKGKTKVGVVKSQGKTETTLRIEGIPEINGIAKLKKNVGKKPVTWEGELERKGGKHFKMKVEFRDG